MNHWLLTLLLITTAIAPAQAQVYQWVDDQGKTVFGDSPPDKASARPVDIEQPANSGIRLASPDQIKEIGENAREPASAQATGYIDHRCRKHMSDLNKIEIFLQHTPNDLDRQKARDLRQLIKKDCGKDVLHMKHDDWRCNDYREKLSKTEIYLQHTPNQRDRQKAEDLRTQIARECR